MDATTYTTADVAREIGCDPATIRRRAADSHGTIGRRHGRDWLFTAADLDRLRATVRPGPGCPAFVAGNDGFAKRRKAKAGKA